MDSFLFSLALFAFWGLLGFATISVFPPRLRFVQGVLISPAIGIAVTILPVFFINRYGVPVKDFGLMLVLVLVALSCLALVIRRPVFSFRRCLPFIALLFVALLLAGGRPMFSYGFDWVSFSNDDMANYSLGAQRFLNHGFFDQPNLADLFDAKDYSLVYWFMHVAGGVRAGSELMLAWVWAFSGLNAHQVFMPVIMALHLALIAGTGAVVSGLGNSRKTPMIAMALLALSPLTTLGALYQLIGQVGGLALLCAAVTLMYRPQQFKPLSRRATGILPAVLVFAAIFVWYPEVLPFFGLGWLLYTLLMFIRHRERAMKVILPAAAVGVLVLIALNKYVLAALGFMLSQASGGMQSADLSNVLFPYFLVPSGLATFWGLMPIASDIPEPYVSLAIAGGLVLIYWMARKVIPVQLRKGTSPVSIFLPMFAMGLLLFFRNNDFGLFKLAMFVQPFLMGVIAVELASFNWQKTSYVKKVLPFLVLVPMVISQFGYVGKSTGEVYGGLNEIPRASAQKVNQQFRQLFDTLRQDKSEGYISDTSNIVLAKFQSLYTQGESLIFPSRNFFLNIVDATLMIAPSLDAPVEGYEDFKKREFIGQQIQTSAGLNKFVMRTDSAEAVSGRTLITTVEKQTIFNAYQQDAGTGYFKSVKSPENHLVFVHSELGNHYYFGDRKKISFYQLENDPMFPGEKISALGEQFLFFVMGASSKPRMVMELTDTVVKQFGSELPVPKVQNVPVNFVGRGSGRIYSEPIEPTRIDGVSYIAVDMARKGAQFFYPTRGLMLLYGRDVPADQRRVTAFGRDISLVSDAQYQALTPPPSLQKFPADLGNKNLEYSGIYEDGWISEESTFMLRAQADAKFFSVKGSVPLIDDPKFSSVIKISVDGKEIAQQKIVLGNFELKVPVNVTQSRQRVGITFAGFQKLPGNDGRITGGKIDFIGFTQK